MSRVSSPSLPHTQHQVCECRVKEQMNLCLAVSLQGQLSRRQRPRIHDQAVLAPEVALKPPSNTCPQGRPGGEEGRAFSPMAEDSRSCFLLGQPLVMWVTSHLQPYHGDHGGTKFSGAKSYDTNSGPAQCNSVTHP